MGDAQWENCGAETLLEELEAYRPWNDQEERDRAELLRRLRSGEALYTRDNAAGHLTVRCWCWTIPFMWRHTTCRRDSPMSFFKTL